MKNKKLSKALESQDDSIDSIPSMGNTPDDDIAEHFNHFFDYISSFTNFTSTVKETLNNYKKQQDIHDAHKIAYTKQFSETIEHLKNVELEALNLVKQIQTAYDDKVQTLKDAYEKRFSKITQKYKEEIQRYRLTTSDSKIEKNVKSTSGENERLKELEEVNDKLQSDNEKYTKVMKELENEKSTFEVENKQLKKEIEKLKTQNESFTSTKTKVENLNSQIKSKEKLINNLEEKVDKIELDKKQLEMKYNDMKENHDKVCKQLKELKNSKMTCDEKKKNDEQSKSDKAIDAEEYGNLQAESLVTKIELRAAKKELERKTELFKDVREELHQANIKIKDYEEQIQLERQKLYDYKLSTHSIENENLTKKRKMEGLEAEILNLKYVADEDKKNLDLKIKEISELKDKESRLILQKNEVDKRNELLLGEIEAVKRKLAQLKVEYEKNMLEMTEHRKLEKSYAKLKILTAELEEQVKMYQQKLAETNSTKNNLLTHKTNFDFQLKTLQTKLEKANHENEMLLSKLNDIENQMQKRIDDKEEDHQNLMSAFNAINNEYTRFKGKIDENNSHLNNKQKHIEDLLKENEDLKIEANAIKEEASNHISTIAKLTKKVNDLEDQLYMKEEYEQSLKDKIHSYQDQLKELEDAYALDKMAWNMQSTQHMKLFEYLQSSFSNKKKLIQSLSDKDFKFFSSHKAKDVDSDNSSLNNKGSSKENPIKKEAISPIKLNKKEEEGVHRYELVKVGFTTLCVACGRDMFFGQKAKKCLDCHSTIHNKCDLLNNCGQKVQDTRQKFHTSDSLCSRSEYSDNVEPSAPTDFDLEDDDNASFNLEDYLQALNEKDSEVLTY